ncbi:hypothetical protein ACJX0J_042088 [Zea mays]
MENLGRTIKRMETPCHGNSARTAIDGFKLLLVFPAFGCCGCMESASMYGCNKAGVRQRLYLLD